MQGDLVGGVTNGKKGSDQVSPVLGWNREQELC